MTQIIPFTSEENTVSRHNRSLSVSMTPSSAGKIYSIFLWDIERGEVYQNGEWDSTKEGFSPVEYYFRVPPKVVEMDEPFTPHITPTQHGGKYTENHGSIIKMVKLSGTTGVRPFKKDLINGLLDPSEVTGHDSIIALRNVFRVYSDLLQQGRNDVCMIYRNIKDDDYWVVEPAKILVKQDSGNPFGYTYDIQLKTLTRFTFDLTPSVDDPIAHNPSKTTALVKSSYKNFLDTFFRTILSNDIINGGFSAIRGLQNPLRKVLVNLNTLSGIPKAAEALVSEVETLASLLQDIVVTGSDIGEDFTRGESLRLFRSLRRALTTCFRLLTDPLINRGSSSNRGVNRWNRTVNAYDAPNTACPSFIGNSYVPSSVSEGRVNAGEDIRGLSSRVLGDSRRWQEIVILNDLKPPYISSQDISGTLSPGSTFLYPNKRGINLTGITSNPRSALNVGVDDADLTSQSTLFYGRDIRVKSTTVNGVESTDLKIGSTGDISSILGIPNVEQGIRLKFSTERGELPAHPIFGAKFPIGSKATISSFNDFRINVEATLRSDYRVQDILKLDLVAIGDILTVSTTALLVDSREVLNTSFAIRRL